MRQASFGRIVLPILIKLVANMNSWQGEIIHELNHHVILFTTIILCTFMLSTKILYKHGDKGHMNIHAKSPNNRQKQTYPEQDKQFYR